MADLIAEAAAHNSNTNRKRSGETKDRERKLIVGTMVEVRHINEGLRGSWHPGVVVACEKSIRIVEYVNLLDDDGSSKLKEQISVSSAVEGRLPASKIRKNYRGYIRPLVSNSSIQESTLSCGLCVDAFVNEAWWEGVVFDREEGSKERVVFFPDQGDQNKFDVNHLRVTQDWDEVSGDWKPRGDWLFVRMLEKHKGFLPVSVRQIWYDVRSCDDFRRHNLEWMHGEESLWDKLVSEAVQENMHAACGWLTCAEPNIKPVRGDNEVHKASKSWKPFQKEFLPKAKFSPLAMSKYCALAAGKNKKNIMSRSAKEAKMHLLFMGWKFEYRDHIKKIGGIMKKCVEIRYVSPDNKCYNSLHKACLYMVRKQKNSQISTNGSKSVGEKLVHKTDAPSVESFNPDSISITQEQVDAEGNCSGSFCKNQVVNVTRRVLPAVHLSDAVHFEAEHCPQAVEDYLSCHPGKRKDNQKDIIQLRSKAKMHLSANGWSFFYRPKRAGKKVKRELNYKSPSGRCFGSLWTACEALVKGGECGIASEEGKGQVSHCMESKDLFGTAPSVESFNPEAIFISQEQVDAEGNCSPSLHKNQGVNVTRQVLPAVPLSYAVPFEAEDCPQAVKDYLDCHLGKMKVDQKDIIQLRSKAKMHLSANGWSFYYRPKRAGEKVKRELHYKSPSGKSYASLWTACEALVKGGIASEEGKGQVSHCMESKDLVGTATSTELEGCEQLLHGQSGFPPSLITPPGSADQQPTRPHEVQGPADRGDDCFFFFSST